MDRKKIFPILMLICSFSSFANDCDGLCRQDQDVLECNRGTIDRVGIEEFCDSKKCPSTKLFPDMTYKENFAVFSKACEQAHYSLYKERLYSFYIHSIPNIMQGEKQSDDHLKSLASCKPSLLSPTSLKKNSPQCKALTDDDIRNKLQVTPQELEAFKKGFINSQDDSSILSDEKCISKASFIRSQSFVTSSTLERVVRNFDLSKPLSLELQNIVKRYPKLLSMLSNRDGINILLELKNKTGDEIRSVIEKNSSPQSIEYLRNECVSLSKELADFTCSNHDDLKCTGDQFLAKFIIDPSRTKTQSLTSSDYSSVYRNSVETESLKKVVCSLKNRKSKESLGNELCAKLPQYLEMPFEQAPDKFENDYRVFNNAVCPKLMRKCKESNGKKTCESQESFLSWWEANCNKAAVVVSNDDDFPPPPQDLDPVCKSEEMKKFYEYKKELVRTGEESFEGAKLRPAADTKALAQTLFGEEAAKEVESVVKKGNTQKNNMVSRKFQRAPTYFPEASKDYTARASTKNYYEETAFAPMPQNATGVASTNLGNKYDARAIKKAHEADLDSLKKQLEASRVTTHEPVKREAPEQPTSEDYSSSNTLPQSDNVMTAPSAKRAGGVASQNVSRSQLPSSSSGSIANAQAPTGPKGSASNETIDNMMIDAAKAAVARNGGASATLSSKNKKEASAEKEIKLSESVKKQLEPFLLALKPGSKFSFTLEGEVQRNVFIDSTSAKYEIKVTPSDDEEGKIIFSLIKDKLEHAVKSASFNKALDS